MKKIIYVLMLVLGMSVLLYSCEKEGGESDNMILEGKWWIPTKAEALFNGSVVYTGAISKTDEEFYKIFFENGTCTYVEDGEQTVFPYVFSDNVLQLSFLGTVRVIKLTAKELVGENTITESYSLGGFIFPKGEVVASYKGKDIYSYDEYYWYYDKNDKAVLCEDMDGEGWFDTMRVYYKAE